MWKWWFTYHKGHQTDRNVLVGSLVLLSMNYHVLCLPVVLASLPTLLSCLFL